MKHENLFRLLIIASLLSGTAFGQQTGKITGAVTYLEVDGNGPASAQLLFVVTDAKGNNHAMVVLAYPSSEPQVFVAMSNLLAAAMTNGNQVTAQYVITGGTDKAIAVRLLPKPATPPPPACKDKD